MLNAIRTEGFAIPIRLAAVATPKQRVLVAVVWGAASVFGAQVSRERGEGERAHDQRRSSIVQTSAPE